MAVALYAACDRIIANNVCSATMRRVSGREMDPRPSAKIPLAWGFRVFDVASKVTEVTQHIPIDLQAMGVVPSSFYLQQRTIT